MNTSHMFSLNWSDVAKGFAMASIGAIVAGLAQAMSLPGFDFASFNWANLVTVGVSAGLAYLVKNYFSDDSGRLFGSIG